MCLSGIMSRNDTIGKEVQVCDTELGQSVKKVASK